MLGQIPTRSVISRKGSLVLITTPGEDGARSFLQRSRGGKVYKFRVESGSLPENTHVMIPVVVSHVYARFTGILLCGVVGDENLLSPAKRAQFHNLPHGTREVSRNKPQSSLKQSSHPPRRHTTHC